MPNIDRMTGLLTFGSSGGGGGGGGTSGGGKFYKCVEVGDGTWAGCEWVLADGVYSKSAAVTSGLVWTSVKPVLGKSYSADALVEVAGFATELNELSEKIQSGYYTSDDLGSIFAVNHATFGTIEFEIVQVDKADIVGGRKHSITLMTKYMLRYIGFDGRETYDAPRNRASTGYNYWPESNIRQWLNSEDLAPWFTPQNSYDQEPSSSYMSNSRGAYSTNDGFMTGFDADFLKSVATVNNRVAIAEGNSAVSQDRFYLPSYTELSGEANMGVMEGTAFANFTLDKVGISSDIYDRCYYLRSAEPGSVGAVRRRMNDGAPRYDSDNAYQCNAGLVVCCVLY